MFGKIIKDKPELFPGTNTGTINQLVSENDTATNESAKFIFTELTGNFNN